MSFVDNFVYSFKNDSIYRKKSITIAAGAGLLIILIIVFLRLNFSSKKTEPKAETKVAPAIEKIPVKKEKVFVAANSLANSSAFKKVGTDSIGYPDDILISNGVPSFINANFYFTSNNKPVVTETPYSRSQFYSSPDGIIINEQNGSSIFTADGKIKGFPANVGQVIPIVSTGGVSEYYFLSNDNKILNLSKSSKIDLSDKTLVATFAYPKDKAYQILELKEFNKEIYLFGFENATKEGKIDIYSVKQNNFLLEKELAKVTAFKYGKNQIAYSETPAEVNFSIPTITNVLDFTNPKLPIVYLDITNQLLQDEVKGALTSSRCALSDTSSIIYCLIKSNPESDDLAKEPDALAQIDWKTKKVNYIQRNNIFSGASIFLEGDKNIYIVGQFDKNLYKLNSVDNQ
jgi:hypothetical protein